MIKGVEKERISIAEKKYIKIFTFPKFEIKKLERAYNSIKPRENKELFFIFEVK